MNTRAANRDAQQIQRSLLAYQPPLERTSAQILRAADREAHRMNVPLEIILDDWACGAEARAPILSQLIPEHWEETPVGIVSPLAPRVGRAARYQRARLLVYRVWLQLLRVCGVRIRRRREEECVGR